MWKIRIANFGRAGGRYRVLLAMRKFSVPKFGRFGCGASDSPMRKFRISNFGGWAVGVLFAILMSRAPDGGRVGGGLSEARFGIATSPK